MQIGDNNLMGTFDRLQGDVLMKRNGIKNVKREIEEAAIEESSSKFSGQFKLKTSWKLNIKNSKKKLII